MSTSVLNLPKVLRTYSTLSCRSLEVTVDFQALLSIYTSRKSSLAIFGDLVRLARTRLRQKSVCTNEPDLLRYVSLASRQRLSLPSNRMCRNYLEKFVPANHPSGHRSEYLYRPKPTVSVKESSMSDVVELKCPCYICGIMPLRTNQGLNLP